MLCRKSKWCLVHWIAGPESEEETFWKLVGERCESLGYDGRVSSDHVCYCDSDPDPPGPRGYSGECCEGFWGGCGFCPVEQMVVYEDGVEAVFLAELCALNDVREGFVGREEDSATELDLTLHNSAAGVSGL